MAIVSSYTEHWWLAGNPKSVEMRFDNGTVLTNENIVQESLTLTETITDTQNFSLGQVFSSECRIKIFNDSNTSYAGQWFKLKLITDSASFDIGRYKVESEKTSDDRVYKEIVAYDALHDILSQDFAEWHNSLNFPTYLSRYRSLFFSHVGISYINENTVNGSINVNRTFITGSYSGADVLRCILEIEGGFIHMGRNGETAYIRPIDLTSTSRRYDVSNEQILLGGFKREDYQTKQIARVHIRTIDGLTSGSSPTSEMPGQTYYITNNPLVSGKTSTELASIAGNIRNKLKWIYFYPSTLNCFALPWMEVGDIVRVYTGGRYYTFPIFHRVMSGINAIRDTYTANGTEQFTQTINSGNITVQTAT